MRGRPVNPENHDDIPPPPWQMRSSGFVVLGCRFDEARIRSLIPPSLELALGATGGFYHYDATEGWGVTPYVAGLAYVDVEGYDAPDGTKAKHAFVAYFQPRGLAGFNRYLGLPEVAAGDARISVAGDRIGAESGPPGSTHLRCSIEVTADPATTPVGSGVNYWVWDKDGEVHGMACSFTSRFLDSRPVSAEILAPRDSRLGAFQPQELLWAGWLPDSIFSISSPYVLGSSLRLARQGREAAYLSLLAEIGLGAVAMRPDGRTLYVNRIAQALLGDGLLLDGGRLLAEDAGLREPLAAAVDRALAGRIDRAAGEPIALPRSSGRKPLIVQAFRLNAVGADMGEEPAVLLLITDPARGHKADPIRALQLIGLTPAEARIAALVGSGLSPREASEMVGNSEGTVRNTLKQVYEKLDIGRQAELARLVARLEAVGT